MAQLRDALTLFDEHRITTLFVVDDGRPVGVVHWKVPSGKVRPLPVPVKSTSFLT